MADKTPVDVYQQFVNGDKSLIIDTEEINIAEFECYIKQEFDIRPSKEENLERWEERFLNWIASFTCYTSLFLMFYLGMMIQTDRGHGLLLKRVKSLMLLLRHKMRYFLIDIIFLKKKNFFY